MRTSSTCSTDHLAMDRPGFKLADRSLKLLETIVAEDLEAFSETLKECQLDEVIFFFFYIRHHRREILCRSRNKIEQFVIHASGGLLSFVSDLHVSCDAR